MVGSPFIVVNKNGRRTLLNTAHITSVSARDILLTDAVRRLLWGYPPEQEIGYMVQVIQSEDSFNFLFTDSAERDELLDKITAAISPSTTIDSAPGLPYTPVEIARMCPIGKYILDGEEYKTREEYEQAREERNHREAMAVVEAKYPRRVDATPPAPSEKPPRKPYTRKPRE